jgi:hypothetical protein
MKQGDNITLKNGMNGDEKAFGINTNSFYERVDY